MYHLYGMPKTRSLRVAWALEELGVEYCFQLVDLGSGGGQSAAFQALNPSGKVPVLKHAGLVLSESVAICTYLGDQHPQAGLVPRPGSADRGRYDQYCCFVISELEQPLWTLAKHKFALPKEKRVAAVLDVARWEFQRVAAVLEQHLAGRKYLVGDSFSMADLLTAQTLLWARTIDMLHGSSALDEYQQQVCSRPALERARKRESGGETDG